MTAGAAWRRRALVLENDGIWHRRLPFLTLLVPLTLLMPSFPKSVNRESSQTCAVAPAVDSSYAVFPLISGNPDKQPPTGQPNLVPMLQRGNAYPAAPARDIPTNPYPTSPLDSVRPLAHIYWIPAFAGKTHKAKSKSGPVAGFPAWRVFTSWFPYCACYDIGNSSSGGSR